MNRLRERARNLRNIPTDAERVLWNQLRLWQLGGYKFRRQQPLGRYIVDFVCFEKRVIIELDGGQHAQQTTHDHERDAWLRHEGFVVLRFWNNEVLQNCQTVKEIILNTVLNTPHLKSSPARGADKEEKNGKTTPTSADDRLIRRTR